MTTTETMNSIAAPPGIGTATIIAIDADGTHVRIRFENDSPAVVARLALPPATALHEDDEVLALRDANGAYFVTSILNSAHGRRKHIHLAPGRYAEVEEAEAGSVIRIYAGGKEPLFEYDATSHTARLVSEGDLDVVSRRGAIRMTAAQGIRLTSPTIELTATSRLRLAVVGALNKAASVIGIESDRIKVDSPEHSVSARRMSATFDESRQSGRRAVTQVAEHRVEAERLETAAAIHRSDASEYRQSVDGVYEVKAGRVRMLVDRLLHLRAGRASIKAKDDVNVDGRRIHLG